MNNDVLLRILFFLVDNGNLPKIKRILAESGFAAPHSLLHRHGELRKQSLKPLGEAPKTFALLSRVTIGADILITSIIVQRLLRKYPQSEIVLLGPPHLQEIFSGQERIRSLRISYERNCSLVERIAVSGGLHEVIGELSRRTEGQSLVLVDPDSRLSQLGLMPLLPLSRCRYFCSREQRGTGENDSLVQICNRWLDQWVGDGENLVYPKVFLENQKRQAAKAFMQLLRGYKKYVLVINLGVGKDERKRAGDRFEESLLLEMLKRRHLLVVLDSGSSPAGRRRAGRLMEKAAVEGFKTVFFDERDLSAGMPVSIEHDLVGIRSSIGLVGALIAEADCFFGYDSCCQHLAAACGTPGVEVFAGHPSERFLNRWRPFNRSSSIEILASNGKGELRLQDVAKLVEEVAQAIDRKIFLSEAREA